MDVVRAWPERDVITVIERLLGELRRILGDDELRARHFLSVLVTGRPGLGAGMCSWVQSKPSSPLAALLATVVSALARAGNPGAVPLAWRLLDTGNIDLARQVARAFGVERGRREMLDGEQALLRTLVAHPDPGGLCPPPPGVRSGGWTRMTGI